MSTPSGLSQKDLDILKHYVRERNRELYWNYLAELPGNDGYGRLALGVVRHDNMPGATANRYAQNYAREHNGKVLSEREWDNFGVDLIKKDLAYREVHMTNGQTHLALNLPAKDIQDAHDKSFNKIEVDPDAWTPRKLLEAARHAGEREAEHQENLAAARGQTVDTKAIREAHVEQVWSSLLDNDALGLHRGKDTLLNLATAQDMPVAERAAYARDMGAAYLGAFDERSHDAPNVIGRIDHYYARDHEGAWVEIHHAQPTIGVRLDQMDDVTDPAVRQRLEDTYRLRQERAAAREAMHPDDPGRHIESPHPLAVHRSRSTLPKPGDDPLYAAIRNQLPMEVSDDKAAEVALRARHAGIHRPDRLPAVEIEERHIVFDGTRRGVPVAVSMDTPAPPREESLAQAVQLDQQAMQVLLQQQEMQQSQQMVMQRSGPVMRL
ncbi:hypothetical protein QFZ41_001992 [Luteibacter sp. W1I16]|uniref:hypothetical protein n=1 Tax=Luteibacter sp. W1I16 TaxID=3373922 RepID=UPI003D21EAB1